MGEERSNTVGCSCEAVDEKDLFLRLYEILEEYRTKPGGLIPILQIAQGIFGYLPENVLKHISQKLDKSYSEVAGVVGFYSFFPPNRAGDMSLKSVWAPRSENSHTNASIPTIAKENAFNSL